METDGIIVTARTTSSRLPNKVLQKLSRDDFRSHYSVITWNLLRSCFLETIPVYLSTSINKEDDKLIYNVNTLNSNLYSKNIKVYRGSLENKLERWIGTAKTYNIQNMVMYDGDDLFCGIEFFKYALDLLKLTKVDCIFAPKDMVIGGFTYAFTLDALEKMKEVSTSDKTEMIEPLITKAKLNCFVLPCLPIYLRTDMRFTLDYEEDLQFFRQVIDSKDFPVSYTTPLYKIIKLLDGKKGLTNINLFRNNDWKNNQEILIKKEGN